MGLADLQLELTKINKAIAEFHKYDGKTLGEVPKDVRSMLGTIQTAPHITTSGLEKVNRILLDLYLSQKIIGKSINEVTKSEEGKNKETEKQENIKTLKQEKTEDIFDKSASQEKPQEKPAAPRPRPKPQSI